MINDIVATLCSMFYALPQEVKVGLVIFIILLVCGYENKRKAEREAEEAAARRSARKTKTANSNNKDGEADKDVR